MTTELIEAPCKPAIKEPPLYKMVVFNDDTSTYQCVIDILVNYFNKSEDEAFELAINVDIEGAVIAGVYPKDIAATKISLANAELKIVGFQLRIESFESK